MAEQRRTSKGGSRRSVESAPETEAPSASGDTAERLRDEIDGLLDEIDEVLETNAEEFVKNYVQKGGQ